MDKRIAFLIAPLMLAGCLSHPAPPEAPYHAYGKNSAWDLIIDDRDVTFIPAGGQPIVQPRPQVIVGFAGEIYQAGRINVNIVHGGCAIGSRSFPDMVQVTIDGGTTQEGCGGDFADSEAPESGTLEGKSWQVVEVNGIPVPDRGDFSMTFGKDGKLGAHFGCNRIGGTFTRSGATVTASNVYATRMACGDVEVFERGGTDVMAQPMQLSWNGPNAILANAAGRIVLAPAG